MATFTGQVRQGLPRTPGGAPWPEGGVAASTEATTSAPQVAADVTPAAPAATPEVAPQVAATPVAEAPAVAQAPAPAPAPVQGGTSLRQGLPRIAGGAPWPDGGLLPGAAPVAAAPAEPAPATAPAAQVAEEALAPVAPAAAAAEAAPVVFGSVPLRRGLPRVAGGEPWPAEGFAPQTAAVQAPSGDVAAPAAAAPAPAPEPTVAPVAQEAPVPAQAVAEPAPAAQPAPTKQAAPAAAAPTPAPEREKREPIMIRGKQLSQWVKIVVLGGLGAIAAAGIIVLAARGVTTLPGVPEWLERYPGEYELPESSEPGFPAWARWGHFFNIFLMVLIIRSGLLVRTQQQPPAFWTPKKGGKKISINLWLHTSLDILWILNGLIFVVLLFVSGHWMRIVPTSWEVFPNAASAMLQYLTLDWPVENGWVNYNSLQQIMYFLVVFIAAPLAIITGLRMSEWWPQKAEKLNKAFPAPVARALHFPTMLFFVLFILIHIFLVVSTGILRNLNHMFAGIDVVNWTGFWLFALTLAITAAGWVACKPLVLAPIASAFGKVSNR